MKKLKIVLCIVLVMLCCFQRSVSATVISEEPAIPVSSYQDMELDIAPIFVPEVARQQNPLAATYVSPYVTAVKNQNPYSTCWAFAFMGASEASLVREGLAEKNILDLSEWHLSYFLSHAVIDPLKGTVGDQFTITSGDYLEDGGSQEFATFRVASWCGPVDEQVAPYTRVTTNPTAVLGYELAYKDTAYHLEDAYWISMKDRSTVKQMIQQYGACAASYYDENVYYSTGKSASLNQTNAVAVYCPIAQTANHAITIVGWDDNFGRENFGTYKPQSDGAWYCKNSWGEEWSKDGYFWLSYEDLPLNESEAFVYDYGKSDNYDNNYQYDGGVWSDHSYECDYSANVYTAQKDEYLRAVGFYTRNSNYNCKIKIYKIEDETNPVSGQLLLEQSANQIYAGFHTIELDKSVELKKNDKFSVVIYQSDMNGNSVPVFVDASCEGSWYKNVSVAEVGQSFIYKEGYRLYDISEKNENCRIKAYTDDKVHVTDLKLNKEEVVLHTGDIIQLDETIIPENASVKDVIWSSSDENVATVDEYGNVTAQKAGEAVITCNSSDNNMVQTECRIVVEQWVTGLKLDYAGIELAVGDEIELNASVIPKDATNQTMEWTSSDEEIVTVTDDGTVKAIGFGTAMITCVAADRNEHKAVCKVTVYKRMEDITLEQTEISLTEGERRLLNVTTIPDISDTKGVYWISSNQMVAKVDDNGLVTAVAPGKDVEVRCIAKDGSGIYGVCKITVNSKTIIQDKEDTMQDKENVIPEPDDDEKEEVAPDTERKEELFMNGEYRIMKQEAKNPTVELIDGSSYRGTVIIPATIKENGITYKVVSIGSNALKNNKKITKVVLGKNVIQIGRSAFQGCSNLSSVSMNKGIKKIGDKSFYQCKKLKKIVIPSKVKYIGKRAFYKCSNLKNIQIKTSALTKKNIGKDALKGIHKKAVIKVPKKQLENYRQILKTKGIKKQVKIIQG